MFLAKTSTANFSCVNDLNVKVVYPTSFENVDFIICVVDGTGDVQKYLRYFSGSLLELVLFKAFLFCFILVLYYFSISIRNGAL